MKKKGHTSIPYGDGYKSKESKSVNESEIKTIHDLLVALWQKYKTFIRKWPKIQRSSPRDKTMAIIGISLWVKHL